MANALSKWFFFSIKVNPEYLICIKYNMYTIVTILKYLLFIFMGMHLRVTKLLNSWQFES